MQHVSILLKPVGKPPPYPPPRPTRRWCISSLAACTAHNESYPADLCTAVMLARTVCSQKKKKEMDEKYYEKEKKDEKEKKYEWRTQWKNKRWNARIARRYGEWQRRCLLLRVQETQLQHISDDEQKVCQDSTYTNDDPERLFKATNAPPLMC